jgi:hypothetical protein
MAGMDEDDRTFMRELLGRHEKATDAMIARYDAGFDEMIKRHDAGFSSDATIKRFNAGTEQLREHTREMREDHRGFVEEMRAQRMTLFRILDRLDEGGAGAGA